MNLDSRKGFQYSRLFWNFSVPTYNITPNAVFNSSISTDWPGLIPLALAKVVSCTYLFVKKFALKVLGLKIKKKMTWGYYKIGQSVCNSVVTFSLETESPLVFTIHNQFSN